MLDKLTNGRHRPRRGAGGLGRSVRPEAMAQGSALADIGESARPSTIDAAGGDDLLQRVRAFQPYSGQGFSGWSQQPRFGNGRGRDRADNDRPGKRHEQAAAAGRTRGWSTAKEAATAQGNAGEAEKTRPFREAAQVRATAGAHCLRWRQRPQWRLRLSGGTPPAQGRRAALRVRRDRRDGATAQATRGQAARRRGGTRTQAQTRQATHRGPGKEPDTRGPARLGGISRRRLVVADHRECRHRSAPAIPPSGPIPAAPQAQIAAAGGEVMPREIIVSIAPTAPPSAETDMARAKQLGDPRSRRAAAGRHPCHAMPGGGAPSRAGCRCAGADRCAHRRSSSQLHLSAQPRDEPRIQSGVRAPSTTACQRPAIFARQTRHW